MDPVPLPPPQKLSSDLQDYSGEVTSVTRSTLAFLWLGHPIRSFFVFIIAPICGIFILFIYFLYSNNPGHPTSVIKLPFAFVFLPLLIPVFSYRRVAKKMRNLFFTELATTLNCSYTPVGSISGSGRLFVFGDVRRMTNVLSGTYKSVSFRLADYTYEEGSGKNRRVYNYIVGELTVNGSLPHILCKPAGWFSGLIDVWKPGGTAPLTLEGDFNSKFNLYVKQDQEIEALQILEPNVMAKLMDGFSDYSFECIDSHVYLFKKGEMRENRESVLALYSLLTRFCDILLPELQNVTTKA